MRFISFSLSNKKRNAISKNGSAGTLYLAIAPSTGVVSPMIRNWIMTNDKQNKTYSQRMIDRGLMKRRHSRMIRRIRMFSAPAISIIGDFSSHK